MLKRIKDTIRKFSMLKKGDNVLVAISGGPDSVCLLLVLNSIKKEFGINLFCAHLNHQLRGVESDCDERYVKRLTKKHRIPLLIESRNVTKFAKDKKFSLEQAARKLRYDFLLQTAKKIGADKIAMGHTKDDQVETLFMRLFRGTGLRGLRGIPGVRKISPNISIIRPLIETPREEILFFLKKRKIRARLDSTNAQTAFLRNRIRHELLPHIERYYSPRIKEILARTADSLDADYDYLIKQQRKVFKRIAKIKKDASISLPIKGLKSLPLSFKRGVVRLAIENVKGNLEGIDYRHWVKIEDLMEGVPTCLHLPGGINVVKRPKTVHFMAKKNGARGEFKKIVPETNLIKIPGVTKILKRLYIKSSISKTPPRTFNASPNIEYFDADKIKFPLNARFRKPADKMKPLGMKRYKRLQDIFVDDKIKAIRRNRIPIIVDAMGRIIWVCGVRMSEDFKVTPHTRKCLRLKLTL